MKLSTTVEGVLLPNSTIRHLYAILLTLILSQNLLAGEISNTVSDGKLNFKAIPAESGMKFLFLPGEQVMRIEIANAQSQKGFLDISDENGVSIFKSQVQLWEGDSVIDLDVSEYISGKYKVVLKTDQEILEGYFELK